MAKDKIQEKIDALGDDPKALKGALRNALEGNAKLSADLEIAQQESIEAQDLLVEAHNELSSTPAVSGKPEFKVDKKTYVLVAPKSKFRMDGKHLDVTAESLKENKDLLEKLVEIGSGCLVLKSDLETKGKED